jgi:hypothetical protein
MANLVENIVSLENEADSIVAQAHVKAKETEQSTIAEIEAYRRKLANETEQKVSAFLRETEEKHQLSIAEAQKELVQALSAMDQIPGGILRKQIDRIVTRFSEF